MKSLGKKLIFVLVVAAVLGGLVFAFIEGRKESAAEAERERPVKAPRRVEVENGENVVTFDDATRANSGVVLGQLEAISHRQQLRAYGTVVEPGELTDLRNAIVTAKAQFAKTNATVEVARKDYERVKGLFQANQNVSEKVMQAAEGTLRAEEANAQVAQAALNAAQATARQRWGTIISAWLVENTPEYERLLRQDNLLIQVTLSPGQVLAPPESAAVQTAEGGLIEAKIVSAALRTDPKIQGRSFLYIIPAAGGSLLPGMNVAALLPAGEAAPGALVPASAVVWLQGKAWAYAQIKPGRFARRVVSTEQPVQDGWVQPAAFSRSEAFVVRGAQVLLSEEFRAQISVGEENE